MLSDTLLKHFTTKCCFDMKTTRPSHSAHLIKPQTLRGLINVPAKFHKWGINYNWFHSLIHLLKWHTFIHVLTCFAISPCLRGMSWLPHTLFKVSLSDFCYTKIISTAPRWIQQHAEEHLISHTGQPMRRLYNLLTTRYVLLHVSQTDEKWNFS